MNYVIAFISAFVLSVIFTLIIKKVAFKLNIVDYPKLARKIHKKPVAFMGGLAIFLSFTIVVFYYSFFTDFIIKDFISQKHIIGLFIASLVIIVGGVLDDKFDLPAKLQIMFPVVAVLIIVISGIGITHIRNPFGGEIRFDQWEIVMFWWQGVPYKFTVFADMFTFIWLMGMTYTTKLLDGLDGLVSGITIIGAIIIFIVAMTTIVAQPNTALISLVLAGAFLGFLIFNWHPAKIFLGEGGSLYAGLMLGVLAILSGSKVATTLLIFGIPILDVIYIILWRIKEGKNPFSTSDKKHLHFRLLDIGMSHRQAVIFYWFLTLCFGLSALIFQTLGKFITMIILIIVMIIISITLFIIYRKKERLDNQENLS